VAGGALGAWIAAQRQGILLPPVADAVAPGIAIAQAIGRWGNWFNQELFGRPTDLPWALEIAPANRPAGYEQFDTFHPTFLYESLWCLLVAGIVIWADRRFTLGHGRAFALYVFLYSIGRLAIEAVRIDDATIVAGLRINIWTAAAIALLALAYLIVVGRRKPGREPSVYRIGTTPKAAESR
jgi:prolipoprotein diacylglyceryl transferase